MIFAGPQSRSSLQLSLPDLAAVAAAAVEFGYLGTAARILQTVLTNLDKETDQFKKDLLAFKKNVILMNNGYMEKSQSIVTDKYVFSPYLLGDNLRRRKKQPKFITEGKHTDYRYIWGSASSDGALFATRNDMLRSCGGSHRRVKNYYMALELGAKNRHKIILRNKPEIKIHKCKNVHHQEGLKYL